MPVYSTVEKIVEVPYLLEKIVEKIVIMPQVVEVLKYVHEIVEEETLGVAIGADINISEIKYKELYAQIRIHFESVLVELRKLKVQTPGLKVQIEIIETFLIELDKIIQFPRFYQIEKEKIVEKEVNKAVLVPTKDSQSIRSEIALSLLVEKLVGEIRTIKQNNSNIKLNLDEDLQLIFFSEAFGGNAKLNEDLNSQLRSYKESQYNKLFSLGKTWTNDHDMIVNTILEERFTMANMVKQANLEIEKSKAISDQRLEAYRLLRQNLAVSQTKFENLERELGVVSKNLDSNSSASNELRRLFGSLDEIRSSLTLDVRSLRTEETTYELGEIHGSGDGFIRLQSAFRALEKENSLLRERYVKWQKEVPNAQALSDKERIIQNLSKQISSLTSELSTVKSQPTTSVNVSSNVQEYEIKIRTLNSRIQELESQLRTQRVDYEGQLRTKNTIIRELEEKIATAKIDDSRNTTVQSSAVERLTSSQHSASSNSGSQVSSSYTAGSASNYSTTGGLKTYGTSYGTSGNSTTQPANYTSGTSNISPSNQGQTSTTSYKSSTYGSSGLSGSGVGGGATYGTSGQTTTYGTSGTSGTSGNTAGTTGGATYGTSSNTYGTSSGTYGTSGSGVRYTSSTANQGQGSTSITSSTSSGISGSGVRYTSSSSTSGTGTGAAGTTNNTNTSGTGASGTSYTPYTSYYNRK